MHAQGGLSKADADVKWEEMKKKAREKEGENEAFRRRFCEGKAGVLAVLCALCSSSNSSSVSVSASSSMRQSHLLASTFKTLAEDPTNRGPLLREGAVRCLLAVCARLRPLASFAAGDKALPPPPSLPNVVGPDVEGGGGASNLRGCDVADTAAHALAKIMVTTNPHLLPHEQLLGLIRHLPLLMSTGNELAQFEAALALTNVVRCCVYVRACVCSRV